MVVDNKDFEILKILEENSRISNVEIAKVLKISEAAVRKRIKKLKEKGIIKRFTIDLDYKKIGLKVSYTGIDVKSEFLMKVVDYIKSIEGVEKIWLCSGDHHILTKIVAKSSEELKKIHEEIEKIDGVLRVCPSIVLDEIK